MKYTKYLPLVLLLSFSTKLIIFGVDFASMGIILGLSCLVGFFEYKDNEKIIKELLTKVDGFSKDLDIVKKSNQDLQTYINAAKVSNVFSGQVKKF